MDEVTLGVLIVVGCTVIEGLAQVFLKLSAMRAAITYVRYSWIAAGVGLYLIEVGLYTIALRLLSVGSAFAISSLSFVTVVVLAAWMLKERVSPTRWAGIGLILAGVTLIIVHA